MSNVISYRPDLPDFGAYLFWPSDGVSWIHPHDIAVARQLLPSRRVFQRVRYDETYYHLHYGHHRIRVRPTMWTQLPACDVQVGDQVELLSLLGQEEPGIATVAEILANRGATGFEFRLRRTRMVLPKIFVREQFRLIRNRHRLRVGYYTHQSPRFVPPQDIELLNVGELD